MSQYKSPVRTFVRRIVVGLSAVSLLAALIAAVFVVRAAFGEVSPVRIVRTGEYELAASGGRLWLLRHGSQVTHSQGPRMALVALALAMPGLLIGLHRGRRKLRPAGLCRRCGYDLRATPERCPECGTRATRPCNGLSSAS
jgi:hypothetical protein